MTQAHPGRVFITIAMLALGCGAASSASALDAYWRAERGPNWEGGFEPIGETSNWYSQPQGGQPREVPDGRATFNGHAKDFEVLVTERGNVIGTMAIVQDAPRYRFVIMPEAQLTVNGNGLVNASPHAVNILVREGGLLTFDRGARLIGSGRSANIEVQRASVGLHGTAHGGNAFVKNNGGGIVISELATAGQMTIDNDGLSSDYGTVSISERSTGGDAKILNREFGEVGFYSRGPSGDGTVSAGKINNRGRLLLGLKTKQLVVREDFVQTATGFLSTEHSRTIVVRGSARIAGELQVLWTPLAPTPPGSYRVLRAQGGLEGKFKLVPDAPKSRLRHTVTDVYYVIDP